MALTAAAEGATAAVSLGRGTEGNRRARQERSFPSCFTCRSRACSVIAQIPIPRFDLFRAREAASRLRPRQRPIQQSGVKNGVPFCAGQLHWRPRFQRCAFEIRRPSHRTERGQIKGSTAVSGKRRDSRRCRAIEIERWHGPSALDRPGPFQDNRASAPRRSRPMAGGSPTCPLFSNEAAGRQRANHDRLHASHGVEVSA